MRCEQIAMLALTEYDRRGGARLEVISHRRHRRVRGRVSDAHPEEKPDTGVASRRALLLARGDLVERRPLGSSGIPSQPARLLGTRARQMARAAGARQAVPVVDRQLAIRAGPRDHGVRDQLPLTAKPVPGLASGVGTPGPASTLLSPPSSRCRASVTCLRVDLRESLPPAWVAQGPSKLALGFRVGGAA